MAAPPQAATKHPSARAAEKAAWSQTDGDSFGLSKEDFDSMGLAKLTQAEYRHLRAWEAIREWDAGNNARKGMPTYSCAGFSLDPARLDKVRVLLIAGAESRAEIVSGIREWCRNVADVRIVSSEDEAGLVVSLVALETKPSRG